MRSIDQLKIDRIHKATMDIVYSEGFEYISLRHIADLAKVSSGTPYIYYKDKQDLLTNLYYMCLDHVSEGLPEAVNAEEHLREKIYTWVFHMVRKFCDIPLMVKYVIKFYREPELFTEEVKERYTSVYLTLDALCRKSIVSGLSKTQDPVLMQAMLLAPVIQLFDMYEGLEHQFDPEQYTECVRLSVDSVLL